MAASDIDRGFFDGVENDVRDELRAAVAFSPLRLWHHASLTPTPRSDSAFSALGVSL